MQKPKATNPSVTVPLRGSVQEQAANDGFTRVMVDGQPMLLKHADPMDNPTDYTPKIRAKSIGPTKLVKGD